MFIEGIGDEVVFFVVGACVVLLLILLAWKSTEVPDPRPLTIHILRNRETSRVPPRSTDNTQPDTERDSVPSNQDSTSINPQHNIPDLINVPGDSGPQSEGQDVLEATNETSSCTEARQQSPSTTDLPDAGISHEEQPGTSSSSDNGHSTSTLRQRVKEKSESNVIKIRLKYIDDTQKVVEASNQVTLGEFKRQHFQAETTANKTVKLIYNAKVLESETLSLSQLGLDDNCVVHCLVINRPPASATPAAQSNSDSRRQQASTSMPSNSPHPPEADSTGNITGTSTPQIEAGIDVGGLLVPLFGVLMGLIWYCRIAYAAHFTTAATVALVGLSGVFLFTFFICFPIG